MIRKNLFAAAVFAAITTVLNAQDGPPPVKVELRMLAFGPAQKQAEVYAQDPAAKPEAASVPAPVKGFLNHEFLAMELTGRKVVFTSKPERASIARDGETVGEVTLPAGVNSAILLVLPGKPDAKAKFQILVIDDSKKSFPAGSFHGTNLSAFPIRLMLEKKNFDFKPGGTLLIENPPVRDGEQIGMKTFAFRDNQWLAIATSIWTHPGKARSVLIFYQDPASGNIQLRAVDDVAPREPAPADGKPK